MPNNNPARHAMCLVLALPIIALPSMGFISGSSAQTEKAQTQSSQSSADTGQQQTMEGCIVRRETAFYIQPASGPQTKLNAGSSGQNLSSHEGQHVRVTGNQGATSGQTSSSSQTSTASGATSAEPELLITKIDVVADQCPAAIQNQIEQQKKSNPK
jgi:hypothetical protein